MEILIVEKKHLLSIIPNDDYTLVLIYSDDEKRVFDVKPYITGSWYGQLANPDYFKLVRVAYNTAEWPDGQDIAPHELYEESKIA